MEDALWAQLQNTSLEENNDKNRIEPESESDEENHVETSVSYSTPHIHHFIPSFFFPLWVFFHFASPKLPLISRLIITMATKIKIEMQPLFPPPLFFLFLFRWLPE